MIDFLGKDVSKCTKRIPATCRIHGAAARAENAFREELRAQEHLVKVKAEAEPDFAASWKIKTEKDGTVTASVYRSGVPTPPAERGIENTSYTAADAHLPEGRQGRTTGVFAAPTIGGVARWVRGNYYTNLPDVKVRELRVDIDQTYVYSVEAWERASSRETDEQYQAYWKTGMTLRVYMEAVRKNPVDFHPREWELLIPAEGIKSVKPVSAARAATTLYSEDEAYEIRGILSDKPRRLWR